MNTCEHDWVPTTDSPKVDPVKPMDVILNLNCPKCCGHRFIRLPKSFVVRTMIQAADSL